MSTKSPFVDAQLSETLEVYTNGSDELFVKNRKSGVSIRISDNFGGSIIVTSTDRLAPTSKNGVGAFVVEKR